MRRFLRDLRDDAHAFNCAALLVLAFAAGIALFVLAQAAFGGGQ